MRNPFEYWHVVGEDAFCNRRKEVAELVRIIENCGRAFVYSERRFGKTSLVKLAMSKLPKKSFLPIYVDLWPTDSDASFITTVAKAVTEASSSSAERAIELAKQLFSLLKPSITLDDQGNPSLSFGVGRSTRLGPELEEVLAAPEALGRRGRKVVIAFDEFQQILAYGRDDIERRLRSIIQHQRNVAYVFLGSRKHMVREMFLKGSRPLYRSATQFALGPIAEQEWKPFIEQRFKRGRRRIGAPEIHAIVEITQGHPFYTQHLCHVLWDMSSEKTPISDDLVQVSLDMVLQREQYAYAVLWESLTLNQQRFLKALAFEEAAKPFSAEDASLSWKSEAHGA